MNELSESLSEINDPLHFYDTLVGVHIPVEGVLILSFFSSS